MNWKRIAQLVFILIAAQLTYGQLPGQQLDDQIGDLQEKVKSLEWEIQELRDLILNPDTGVAERLTLIEESIGDGIVTWEQLQSVSTRVAALEALHGDVSDPTDPVDPTDPDPDPTPVEPSGDAYKGMGLGMVWRGADPDDPSADGYNELLDATGGGIRFMDWNIVNDDFTVYSSIDQPHKSERGTWREVLTVQVELCNATGSDFYFNAPFHASEEFTRQAVSLIRTNLAPDRRILVAWCNEPWNAVAAPYRKIKAETGEDLGGDKFFDYWAERCVATFRGARRADPTCIRIIEGQTANNWVAKQVVKRVEAAGETWQALGLTTYFNMRWPEDYTDGVTVDQVIARTRDNYITNQRKDMLDCIEYANSKGKLAIAYEGGQHLVDYYHRSAIVETLKQAQSDDRLMVLWDEVLDDFFEAGGDINYDYNFVSYWNKWGYWGKASAVDKLSTSKKYEFYIGYKKP